MDGNIRVKHAGDRKLAHTDLAIKIKRMLNDIIDVVYAQELNPATLGKLKRFTIYATEAEYLTKLGDCWYNKDGSASIRLLGLGRDRYQESLIVAIHEISHHIERTLFGTSGHSAQFYDIHKKLLFASFDMGILAVTDVTDNSESRARNQDKLARMMKDYVPHPIAYKTDVTNIFIYNSYAIKDQLKARGYRWNGLDQAWTKEVQNIALQEEYAFLQSLAVPPENVREVQGGAVVTRLRKSAKLFEVPYDQREVVKKLGYRWVDASKKKYWKKNIDGDDLPAEERAELVAKIPHIRIVID